MHDVMHIAGFLRRGSKTGSSWAYACDGPVTLDGCPEILILNRRVVRVGLITDHLRRKWIATWGCDEYGNDDHHYVLFYCPGCAATLAEQEVLISAALQQ